MFSALFRRSRHDAVIERLRGEIMAAARRPVLFTRYGVPDTFDGRFEALALIATPPVARLAALPEPGPELAQNLTDALFTGFDDALRQIGVSDVGVPKRMKKLAEAWLGRRKAYAEAFAAPANDALAAAIARNLHAGALKDDDPRVRALVDYARALWKAHANAGLETYMKGPAPFPEADESEDAT